MRRVIIMMLAALASFISYAQSYQVFKATDNVSVKPVRTAEWVSAERQMKVIYPDSLSIDKGGSISLLNTNSNQIFVCNKLGKTRVKNAIDESMRDAGNVVAYTTQNLAEAIASRNKSMQYNVYGATMRGSASKDAMSVNEQMVCNLSKAIESVQSGKGVKQSAKVKLQKVYEDDDTYHFLIENSDEKAYVVNVLRIPKDGNPTFCINLDKADSEYYFALVDAQSKLDLSSFVFVKDDAAYVLVASEQVYDASWVERMINEGNSVKQKGSIKTELFIIQ